MDDHLRDPLSAGLIGMEQTDAVQPKNVDSRLARAEYSLKQGAWQESATLARSVLAQQRENSKAHAILGLIAALGGQQEQAEQALTLLQNRQEAGVYPHLIAAVLAGQKNRYQEAQRQLAEVLLIEPEHPVALYYSGSLELAQGKLEQAEKAFQAVLKRSPHFPPALAGLGQVYWRSKQTDKAVTWYRQAIAAEPDTLLYRQLLIALFKATGQKEAEEKAAREMLYFVPGMKERSIEQGLALLHRGRDDEAIKLADALLAVYQPFPFGQYMKAVSLVNKGEKEKANMSIADLLSAGGRTAKTHHEAGLCYLVLGELDGAEEQFKLVLALEPESSRSFAFLPIIEQVRGHRERAINGLSVMLAQKEPPALIHFLQANNYLADGKTIQYRQEMEQGLALIPGMQASAVSAVPFSGNSVATAEHRNLMVLFYFNGWYEQAARRSGLLLKESPADPFALWYNGLARIAQQRYPEAVASLHQLTQLFPTLVAAHMELGHVYALEGDDAKALAALQRAAEIAPAHAPAFLAQGDLYYRTGRDPEAVSAYRRTIEINPELPQAYSTLALLLAEQPATREEARALAERGASLAPRDPSSLDALGWVQVQHGESKAGIEHLRQALDLAPRMPQVMYHLGVGYYRDNQPEQARQWLQAALALARDFRGKEQARTILNTLGQK